MGSNITEWLISGNPSKYDVVGAFRELGTIDWVESANVAIGDIVYIYVSDTVKAVRFKCKANQVNLKSADIDDSKFDISGNFDGSAGRYMELQMLEELTGSMYSRVELDKHGFKSPQGPIRVVPELKEYLDIVEQLQHTKELDPDSHDATYELLRETIRAYANMGDLSVCDYKDLNLVYFMCIGTWKQRVDAKINTIDESHLPDAEKQRLTELLKKLWNKTMQHQYTNHEKEEITMGMFGTGFYTFSKKTDDVSPRNFIKMCVDILSLDDDDAVFNRCEKTLTDNFHGMKAASASVVLHCLKPFTFPIFNSNMHSQNIYEYLGVELNKKAEINTYIENCRKVKKYRDDNFKIKNCRVFDMAAWNIGKTDKHTDIDYLSVLDYLDNYGGESYSNPQTDGLSNLEKQKLINLKSKGQVAISQLKSMASLCCENSDLDMCEPMSWLGTSGTKIRSYFWAQMKQSTYKDSHISVSLFFEMSPATDKARLRISLAIKKDGVDAAKLNKFYKLLVNLHLQNSKLHYGADETDFGKLIDIDESSEEMKKKIDSGEYTNFTISRLVENSNGITNDEIETVMLEAVKELMPYYQQAVNEIENDVGGEKITMNNQQYDKNMILYGPPGTGKTYNSAIYAVAICDNKKISELNNYAFVMKRYNELKKEGRIAFTTFHQSYGYEEFIEGISPVIISNSTVDDIGEVSYECKDGVFKRFCDRACRKIVKNNENNSVNENARVWCVNLGGSETPQLKQECFNEGTIRIGWEDYPEVITDEADNLTKNSRTILLNFQDEMDIGDIVVSFKSYRSIDAIGVVTGPCEFDSKTNPRYPRKRNVNWLNKDIDEDILSINQGIRLNRPTVYPLTRIKAIDILALIENKVSKLVEEETKPYVFIIDEINRGNVSKIFGELITLIETSKRAGMPEAASAILPCSGQEFSVPQNIYIIGTMNTADRSIKPIDTALRRRFQFVEMMPDSNVLKGITVTVGDESLDIAKLLDIINERIAFLYDREHMIGHAFFTSLRDDPSIDNLASIFAKSVIPLLQEYFYEDYQKIQLVLGDNAKSDDESDLKFIKDIKVAANKVFEGSVEDVIDLPEKKYKINSAALYNIKSYKSIASCL